MSSVICHEKEEDVNRAPASLRRPPAAGSAGAAAQPAVSVSTLVRLQVRPAGEDAAREPGQLRGADQGTMIRRLTWQKPNVPRRRVQTVV
jgi:hypothetical protein